MAAMTIHRSTRGSLLAVLAMLASAIASVPAQAQTADPIVAGYLRLYGGQHEDAQAQFDQLRARDAQALAPWFGALFVRMARIEHDDSLASAFEKDLDQFIDTAAARHSRSQNDSEALFYLGQAYLLRATYRLDHDKGMWGAARDAAKSKGFAEDYIKRHPEHGDAYLVLGLYNYYVDIAPNFVKVLRILLFLPSGSRTEGIKQLERASRDGSMFAPMAQTALAEIYGSFENRLAEAIPLAENYVQRFPGNADVRLDLASLYLHPSVEDFARAAEQYSAVIAGARDATPRHLSEKYRGMNGLSSLRRSQWRLEEAVTQLTHIIDEKPSKPAWVMPNALLQRGNYRVLLNETGAEQDARRVLSDAAMKDWHKAAQQQIAFMEQRRKTDEAAIYAALIPGNRFVVDRRFDEARAIYERVAATHSDQWQARYRLASLEFARRDYPRAAGLLEPIVSTPARIPGWIRAAAMLNLARTHDLAGRRAEAIRLYKQIVEDHENEGPAVSARLGLIAPYRGPITTVAAR
jgi:hypothetical protein